MFSECCDPPQEKQKSLLRFCVCIYHRKKESIALLLLKKGASVNLLNNKGRSAVHMAAYNNLEEALGEIIRRGADVNCKVL